MSNAQKASALIASLTLAQAQEYARHDDRLMWVETDLLDPLDIPRSYAVQVEECLTSELAQHALDTYGEDKCLWAAREVKAGNGDGYIAACLNVSEAAAEWIVEAGRNLSK